MSGIPLPENHLIFVYGTLKQGFGNHRLLAGSKFLGTGSTNKKFAMYSIGFPFVCKDEPISQIHGELYQVDDEILQNLDNLEGHPDWYRREKVKIYLDDGNTKPKMKAWIYFNPDNNGTLIPSGKFEYNKF